jgi:hypothetical protein
LSARVDAEPEGASGSLDAPSFLAGFICTHSDQHYRFSFALGSKHGRHSLSELRS